MKPNAGTGTMPSDLPHHGALSKGLPRLPAGASNLMSAATQQAAHEASHPAHECALHESQRYPGVQCGSLA
eukprot:11628247-Alexandrium_andersonii.AAC.1